MLSINAMKKRVLDIDGHEAVITFDLDIRMWRGECLSVNGGADFLAENIEGLHREGRISLKIYLDMCAAKGIDPGRPILS